MLTQRRNARGIQGPPRNGLIAREFDTLGQPKPHQNKLVGALLPQKHLVTGDPVAFRLYQRQPSLRPSCCRGSMALAVNVEPAMRARADAGIFLGAPIDEIVPTLGAGSGMV